MPQDASQKTKRGRKAGWVGPFIEKVTEVVHKVVPEHLVPVSFAGALVAVLVLFLLTVIGFSRDPEKAAKGKIEDLEERLKNERSEHAATRTEKRKLSGTAGTSEYELRRAKDRLERLEKERERLQTQVQEFKKQLKEAGGDEKKLAREFKDFKRKAAEEKRGLVKDRDDALRTRKAVDGSLAAVETQLKEVRDRYNELRGKQKQSAAVHEKARVAFESIVKMVDGIEDPEKKIRAVERLRAASNLDLDGTVYMERLDEKIKRERRLMEEAKQLAQKRAKVDAKDTYKAYMNRLGATFGYEAQMALLAGAEKEFKELDETAYALKVHNEMEDRRTKHEDEVAREVRDQVMRAVALQPKAYEENLKSLEEALEKTKGTRYAKAIQKQVDSRRRTLADDVARKLYEDLVSRVRLNPKGYDENLAYAAEIKPGITQRYEKKFAKQVAAVETAKRDAAGRVALSEAQEHVAKNPTDHEGNITALIGFKTRARDSRYESKLADLLARERKLLLRSRK